MTRFLLEINVSPDRPQGLIDDHELAGLLRSVADEIEDNTGPSLAESVPETITHEYLPPATVGTYRFVDP